MRIRTITDATYVLTLDDVGAYLRFDSASAQTCVVPGNIPFSPGVDTINVIQAGAGALTIQSRTGGGINKAETLVLAKQFAGGALVPIGGQAWDFHGYTTAAA